ncbi:MAG: hypothetical protein II067_05015 [Agathobacter sp.]|uniref:DUF6240 domain-containing protein n=1 Tax=Agathobacter sp. TaxID=2021311 RepID=UPI0025807C4B|nr:DUF6240 domain-containing protein [Agathobacter sp.]MBQ1681563.1 hypothetical protein [Agathobacter sp.]
MKIDLIDNIRENSVKNMDISKGIADYAAQNEETKSSVHKVKAGYVVDSVPQQRMSPTYANPNEEEKTMMDRLQQDQMADSDARKNQMAVLANTTTKEDLRDMQEAGFSVNESTPEQIITVTDRINANIAKTGGEVSGDISKEKLEELVGSEYLATQIAQAFQQNDLPLTDENIESIREVSEIYEGLEGLDGQEMLYLVKNEYEPTLENLYKAEHSAGLATPTGSIHIDEFRSQVEQVIRDAGVEVSDASLKNAQTLLENQIPLTSENLQYFTQLQEMEKPSETVFAQAVADAVAEGNGCKDAIMLSGYSVSERARDAQSVIEDVTDEDLAYCIEHGQELTIRNLADAKAHRGETDSRKWADQMQFLTAKRMLEETRLAMTTEANRTLIRRGFAIDTKPLEALVEELKSQEKNYYETLLSQYDVEPTETNVNRYAQTIDLLAQLKSAPATILSLDEVEATLNVLGDKAAIQKADYEKAGMEYEKLWTAPRKDMGDSIQKAFRNVDDILTDMGLETSDANRRAVRILAYNHTELTIEHLTEMKAQDEQMQRLFSNLTPRTTLELIRRGENPIDMPIEELNRTVEAIKTEIGDNGAERFEKFLHKLEQNKAISEEERSSYIGIYRLIAQVEKNDGAALGAAYEQGSEITMRALLTQLRNQSKKNSDYVVDDQFDGVDAVQKGVRIDRQIEAAFQNQCIKDVAEQMTPGWMQNLPEDWMDQSPEQLRQMLQNYMNENPDGEAETYAKQMLDDLQQAANCPEEIYAQLERMDVPASVHNVLAMEMLSAHPGNAISTIWKAKDALADAKEELLERFAEAVESPTELADALETLEEVAEHALDDMVQEVREAHSLDIRAMQLATKQIHLASKQTSEESFLIPMQTSDGNVTGVSLKVVRGSGKKGFVDIFFESAVAGKISASFEAKKDSISGLVVCEDRNMQTMMSQQLPALAQTLSSSGEQVDLRVALGDANPVQHAKKSSGDETSDSDNSVQTGRLYKIAKAFIDFANEYH